MFEKNYSSGKSFTMYSNEEIARARDVDMTEFIPRYSDEECFVRTGGTYKGKVHDSLWIESDNRSWHWSSKDLYGIGAIDWLVKVNGYSFKEACSLLIDKSPSYYSRDAPKQTQTQSPQPDQPERVFVPPKKTSGQCRELFAYLGKTRGLPNDIIDYCLRNKLIYQDEKRRVVFCGYDKNGDMKFAEAKITNTYKKYYPQNISGSKKEYSFFIPANRTAYGYDPTQIYVFEAPIDLLSHAALMQEAMKRQCALTGDMNLFRADCWLAHNRLSLSGLSEAALFRRLEENPNISKIALCLDNDEKGQEGAKRIQNHLKEKYGDKYHVKVVIPPKGKDWNDTLKATNNSNVVKASVKPTMKKF